MINNAVLLLHQKIHVNNLIKYIKNFCAFEHFGSFVENMLTIKVLRMHFI